MIHGRAVAVLLLALLAGCQGFGTATEAVTPAPVPTAEDTVTADAETVGERHDIALANRSYTTTVSQTVTYPNGTTARLTDEFTVGSDDSYRYERRRRGPYPDDEVGNFTIWQNSTHEVRREPTADGVSVRSATGLDDLTFAQFVSRLLVPFDRTAERADGGTVITGQQDSDRPLLLPDGLSGAHNGTLEAEVRDGIVRSLTIRTRADYPAIDQSVSVVLRFDVDGVDRSEPTRPAWATDTNETAAR